MDAEHTPERYEDAAKFYSESPDGQYDVDAAHALRCHFDLLMALEAFMATDDSFCRVCEAKLNAMAAKGNTLAKVVLQARAALTKAKGQP